MSAVDITGYTIEVGKTPMRTWAWKAKTPDGESVPQTVATWGASLTQRGAEERAVQACEEHAADPDPIDAAALRARLAGSLSDSVS